MRELCSLRCLHYMRVFVLFALVVFFALPIYVVLFAVCVCFVLCLACATLILYFMWSSRVQRSLRCLRPRVRHVRCCGLCLRAMRCFRCLSSLRRQRVTRCLVLNSWPPRCCPQVFGVSSLSSTRPTHGGYALTPTI